MRSRVSIVIALALMGVCDIRQGVSAETNATSSASTNLTARPATWAVKLNRPDLSNLYQVTTNLYRGAQPSAKGIAELKAMGIKTVVNLRRFHSDKDELSGTDLKPGRLHMEPWHAEDEDVIRFLIMATDTNNLPVYVHCQRGADRTGLMCAMYRVVICGWTKDEAIREMKDGGFNFYSGWKNIVRYIENANIEKIKKAVSKPRTKSARLK